MRCNTYLGYAKIDDLWQLAIKEQVTDSEWNPDEREEQPIAEVFMTPLLQASRDVRLSAVDDFDDLIEGLKRDVEAKLKQTKRAEEIRQGQVGFYLLLLLARCSLRHRAFFCDRQLSDLDCRRSRSNLDRHRAAIPSPQPTSIR